MDVKDSRSTVRKKKVQELERILTGVRPRPTYTDMVRWLGATQGDTQAALVRIRENSAWRQSQMVDSFLHWKPPHVLSQYFPGGLSGFDSEDRFPSGLDTKFEVLTTFFCNKNNPTEL